MNPEPSNHDMTINTSITHVKNELTLHGIAPQQRALTLDERVLIADGHLLKPEPILYLHSAPDGYVSFLGRTENGLAPLGSFRANDLLNTFPSMRPYLYSDSYMTVNSLFRPYYEAKATGQPYAPKTTSNLRYLNACYADIDCGRLDDPDRMRQLPPEVILAKILYTARTERTIPFPSLTAYSGRGLYCFWLIRDPDDMSRPQSAFPEKIELYRKLNEKFCLTLQSYGIPADPIKDASRILRTPGSLNTRNDKIVDYHLQLHSGTSQPEYLYSLPELAEFFQLTVVNARPYPLIGYKRPTKRNPKRRRGWQQIGQRYADDLAIIAQDRGGWKKGTRGKSLYYQATFLSRAGYGAEYILKALEATAQACKPPYPSDSDDLSLNKIVQQGKKDHTRKFRSDRLAAEFNITTTEQADRLGLQSIMTVLSKANRANKALLQGRKMQRERRRRLLAGYLKRHPGAHSCRQVLRWLTRQGVKTNYQTVNEEMNLAGCRRATGSPGRPRKKPYPDQAPKVV